jgi:hypothetical protein
VDADAAGVPDGCTLPPPPGVVQASVISARAQASANAERDDRVMPEA